MNLRSNEIIEEQFRYGGGRNKVYVVDPVTGVKDLVYDPSCPDNPGLFGCLLNHAKHYGFIGDPNIPDWRAANVKNIMDVKDLPKVVLLGPKELAGGRGLGITNGSCNQSNLGSCVGACGTNVAEDTMRSEIYFKQEHQELPEVSIRYMYFCCQGYHRRPGGDGAMTTGLANALITYKNGWLNRNYTDMMSADGRFGGVVNEKAFDAPDVPAQCKSGLPYDIAACRRGSKFDKAWVELGTKHAAGKDGGMAARVRDWESYKQVIASGHVCFTGISWPSAWSYVDKEGFCTSGWRGASGGHEIEFCGYAEFESPIYGETQWGCMKNSWGANWAFQGYSMMPLKQMLKAGVFGEMYTVSFVNGWDKAASFDWIKNLTW